MVALSDVINGVIIIKRSCALEVSIRSSALRVLRTARFLRLYEVLLRALLRIKGEFARGLRILTTSASFLRFMILSLLSRSSVCLFDFDANGNHDQKPFSSAYCCCCWEYYCEKPPPPFIAGD